MAKFDVTLTVLNFLGKRQFFVVYKGQMRIMEIFYNISFLGLRQLLQYIILSVLSGFREASVRKALRENCSHCPRVCPGKQSRNFFRDFQENPSVGLLLSHTTYTLTKEYTNTALHVARTNTLCTLAPNILLSVNPLEPRTLMSILHFWKTCGHPAVANLETEARVIRSMR